VVRHQGITAFQERVQYQLRLTAKKDSRRFHRVVSKYSDCTSIVPSPGSASLFLSIHPKSNRKSHNLFDPEQLLTGSQPETVICTIGYAASLT
jgi:hypothetical protein